LKYIGDFKNYEYNIKERIRSLAIFNDFVNRFRKYNNEQLQEEEIKEDHDIN